MRAQASERHVETEYTELMRRAGYLPRTYDDAPPDASMVEREDLERLARLRRIRAALDELETLCGVPPSERTYSPAELAVGESTAT